MIDTPLDVKPRLRGEAIARRNALTDAERRAGSDRIMGRLLQLLADYPEHVLLCYRALPFEVDTNMLFDVFSGTLYAPRIEADHHLQWHRVTPETHWKRGPFGVQEPADGDVWQAGERPTLITCPLTAFDRHGNRLGMGKGFFDRWLAPHRHNIDCIIGLAFACQEFESIPAEYHDIPLDIAITEHEVIPCPHP